MNFENVTLPNFFDTSISCDICDLSVAGTFSKPDTVNGSRACFNKNVDDPFAVEHAADVFADVELALTRVSQVFGLYFVLVACAIDEAAALSLFIPLDAAEPCSHSRNLGCSSLDHSHREPLSNFSFSSK
jgi:hypothetical protein